MTEFACQNKEVTEIIFSKMRVILIAEGLSGVQIADRVLTNSYAKIICSGKFF
jgi:hypothetical protein